MVFYVQLSNILKMAATSFAAPILPSPVQSDESVVVKLFAGASRAATSCVIIDVRCPATNFNTNIVECVFHLPYSSCQPQEVASNGVRAGAKFITSQRVCRCSEIRCRCVFVSDHQRRSPAFQRWQTEVPNDALSELAGRFPPTHAMPRFGDDPGAEPWCNQQNELRFTSEALADTSTSAISGMTRGSAHNLITFLPFQGTHHHALTSKSTNAAFSERVAPCGAVSHEGAGFSGFRF